LAHTLLRDQRATDFCPQEARKEALIKVSEATCEEYVGVLLAPNIRSEYLAPSTRTALRSLSKTCCARAALCYVVVLNTRYLVLVFYYRYVTRVTSSVNLILLVLQPQSIYDWLPLKYQVSTW